jgi:hypothetical protein
MPPASGNIVPNSAYVNPINRMMNVPKTQAIKAAGPATSAALHAPNNHPEPMIEPSPVMVKAKVLISLLMLLLFICSPLYFIFEHLLYFYHDLKSAC